MTHEAVTPSPADAVIVATPYPMQVTIPSASTVATVSSEEVQVISSDDSSGSISAIRHIVWPLDVVTADLSNVILVIGTLSVASPSAIAAIGSSSASIIIASKKTEQSFWMLCRFVPADGIARLFIIALPFLLSWFYPNSRN